MIDVRRLVTVLCVVPAVVAGLLVSSCETESVANNDLTISPASIGLYKNQYADFTASGGFEYTWSLANPSWGVLSNLTGPTVRYTDRYDPGSNGDASVVQVLTVTSVVKSGSTSSNGTAVGSSTGTAQIEHLSTTAATNTSTVISISPSSASLNSGSQAEFTASGGTGSYTWSLSSGSEITPYGTLSNTSGTRTIVTSGASLTGSNYVSRLLSATDSDGSIATATVTFFH
jgi:large repetitive protein